MIFSYTRGTFSAPFVKNTVQPLNNNHLGAHFVTSAKSLAAFRG